MYAIRSYYGLKLNQPQIFEIGKIYFKINQKYIEKYALGVYHPSLSQLQKDLKTLQLKPITYDENYAQIVLSDQDLSHVKPYTPQSITISAYELTHQLIALSYNFV